MTDLYQLLRERMTKKDTLCEQRIKALMQSAEISQLVGLTLYIDEITKDIQSLCQRIHFNEPQEQKEPEETYSIKPSNAMEAFHAIKEHLSTKRVEYSCENEELVIQVDKKKIMCRDNCVLVIKESESLTMPYGSNFDMNLIMETLSD